MYALISLFEAGSPDYGLSCKFEIGAFISSLKRTFQIFLKSFMAQAFFSMDIQTTPYGQQHYCTGPFLKNLSKSIKSFPRVEITASSGAGKNAVRSARSGGRFRSRPAFSLSIYGDLCASSAWYQKPEVPYGHRFA